MCSNLDAVQLSEQPLGDERGLAPAGSVAAKVVLRDDLSEGLVALPGEDLVQGNPRGVEHSLELLEPLADANLQLGERRRSVHLLSASNLFHVSISAPAPRHGAPVC